MPSFPSNPSAMLLAPPPAVTEPVAAARVSMRSAVASALAAFTPTARSASGDPGDAANPRSAAALFRSAWAISRGPAAAPRSA